MAGLAFDHPLGPYAAPANEAKSFPRLRCIGEASDVFEPFELAVEIERLNEGAETEVEVEGDEDTDAPETLPAFGLPL